ncbi:EcsC family protein [Micromonospora sp. DT233]|uniref:EcsC family protein n=1 Tax=Micromonospora sp. DT233 TaxID=3393432 RepID=UPI003CF14F2A
MTDPAPVDGQPVTPAPAPAARPPAVPPEAGGPRPPEVVPPVPDAPETPPARLWDRMREDPQYAPEHLALEAVRRLGPEAAQWAARARAERPAVTAEELAVQAARKFVGLARLSGAVSGAAGLPGAVLDVGVLAWTQARMVLHIAAAHGVDPTHPDRATDLLVLQKVHKVAETARLALGVAAGRERAGALFGRSGQPALGKVMVRLGMRLAQMAGVRAAKRLFAKVIPGAAIVLGTWANSSATKDLAERSRQLYASTAPPGSIPRPRT